MYRRRTPCQHCYTDNMNDFMISLCEIIIAMKRDDRGDEAYRDERQQHDFTIITLKLTKYIFYSLFPHSCTPS